MAHCPTKNIVSEFIGSAEDNLDPIVDGLQSAAFFIATGKYQGMLPDYYAHFLSQYMEIQESPNSKDFIIPFYAITNATRPLSPCVSRFIDILKETHINTD